MVVIAGYVAGVSVRDGTAMGVGVPHARTAAIFLGSSFDLITRSRNPPDKITRQMLSRERCEIGSLNGTAGARHNAFPPFSENYLAKPTVFLMHINTLSVADRQSASIFRAAGNVGSYLKNGLGRGAYRQF